ncbi:AbrB family transcriptional regulator [Capsulimonas corticalis]|uniref:AbrB family transcriptional regulator n=1 Tax=Capsulimonas corticalis TaxID=2219043 RepID=A0A402CT92_9BACT|nr:AbrB/MazE/SpoVT family DNA-binding domain-containing protein [Capsulimonas corticalis]BDI30807.1 AbrB family transcriptional regulator [Capsulimonas corticalis]
MKVTTKGQVTIPQEIREQLGIHPGADVEFKIDGDAVKIIPIRKGASVGKRLVDQMRGKATIKMSTDEILALTRGDA